MSQPPQPAAAPSAPTSATTSAEQAGQMTHREVLEALSGLLLAMFVAMLSSTVVTNALPRIVNDLEGSQTGYTWVVVATLLDDDRDHADLGQARRPVQQEAARADGPGHLLDRLAGRRLRADAWGC